MLMLFAARADHITGGEMHYVFMGINNGLYTYQITAKLFMDCYSNRRLPNPANFGIFNKGTGAHIMDMSIPMVRQDRLLLTNPSKCITNPPNVCYDIGLYDFYSKPARSCRRICNCTYSWFTGYRASVISHPAMVISVLYLYRRNSGHQYGNIGSAKQQRPIYRR